MHVGGTGTIEKRGPNTWRIRLAVGRDPITGKYRQKSRTIHGTKADALRAREELRWELEHGAVNTRDALTFGQFARQFQQDRAISGKFRPATLTGDRMHIRRLCRYLEDVPLTALDAVRIIALQRRMAEDGFSQSMLHGTLSKLRQVLKRAYRLGYISANPCDQLDIPCEPERRMASLDEQGARRLQAALSLADNMARRDRALGADRALLERSRIMACRLALSTGMRRGEVLGLTWENANAERGVLRVVQQFTSEGDVLPPKSRHGTRTISLDERMRDQLAEWMRDQRTLLELLGRTQDARTPVCCNSCGTFQNAGNFSEWWATFRTSNGFPGLRFHDLRHTQATLLIGNGVDIKTVQSRLGHSRAATTLDIYACALPENDRKAANLFGALMENATCPSIVE